MTKEEKVMKAFELLAEGKRLLDRAGFELLFDTTNCEGLYAVPKKAEFVEKEAGNAPRTGVGVPEFVADCPVALDVLHFENGREWVVTNVPSWWRGWDAFCKKYRKKVSERTGVRP